MTASVSLAAVDHDRVGAAVAAAEAASAGEIVTIFTAQSDDYGDIALLWSALAMLLALLALTIHPDSALDLYARMTGDWAEEWSARALFAVAALVAAITFTAVWLVQLWRPLRMLLVPDPVEHARVRARAVTCFKVGAERRTHGRTGILIYLSMRERRAEIVADEAIARKVDPEVWGVAMAAMLSEIRAGRLTEGLIAAVGHVGAVLAEHLPRAADDVNELPDRLIEV